MNRALNRLLPLLAVCALLAAAWLAAAWASPQINNLPMPPLRIATDMQRDEPTAGEPSEAPRSAEQEATEVESPDERAGMIAIGVLFAVLLVGGLVGWLVIRRHVAAGADEPVVVTRSAAIRSHGRVAAAVVEAVDASITELSDADMDPRKAVIACWVRLERAAAAVGTPKHVGDSPTDLVTRLLHDHQVSQNALDDLAVVYREARYAAHAIDEAMRAEAVAALRQVRAELAREAYGVRPPAGGGSDTEVLSGVSKRKRP